MVPPKVRYEIDLTSPLAEASSRPTVGHVRPLRSADRDELAALVLDAYAGTIDDEGETLAEAEAEIDGWLADDPLLDHSNGVEVDGRLVAAVLLVTVDDAPFVALVATAAAAKGAGHGRAVIVATLDGLRRAGHERVALFITQGNTPSERLFASVGAYRPGRRLTIDDPGPIGLIADLHGNRQALDAVLADGRSNGVERWLVLGDVVAMGPAPGAVLDRLAEVDVIGTVAGNTERYVLTGDRPEPTLDQVRADPDLLPRLAEVAASFAWTRGHLTATDQLHVLAGFDPWLRLTLPGGRELLAVHASQGSDDGPGITSMLEDDDLRRLFPEPAADLVVGGHTHVATDRVVDGIRFLNPGSVSNHRRPELGASYAILVAEADGTRWEQREVAYDKRATVAAIRASGIPGGGFLLRTYFGVVEPPVAVQPTRPGPAGP